MTAKVELAMTPLSVELRKQAFTQLLDDCECYLPKRRQLVEGDAESLDWDDLEEVGMFILDTMDDICTGILAIEYEYDGPEQNSATWEREMDCLEEWFEDILYGLQEQQKGDEHV